MHQLTATGSLPKFALMRISRQSVIIRMLLNDSIFLLYSYYMGIQLIRISLKPTSLSARYTYSNFRFVVNAAIWASLLKKGCLETADLRFTRVVNTCIASISHNLKVIHDSRLVNKGEIQLATTTDEDIK